MHKAMSLKAFLCAGFVSFYSEDGSKFQSDMSLKEAFWTLPTSEINLMWMLGPFIGIYVTSARWHIHNSPFAVSWSCSHLTRTTGGGLRRLWRCQAFQSAKPTAFPCKSSSSRTFSTCTRIWHSERNSKRFLMRCKSTFVQSTAEWVDSSARADRHRHSKAQHNEQTETHFHFHSFSLSLPTVSALRSVASCRQPNSWTFWTKRNEIRDWMRSFIHTQIRLAQRTSSRSTSRTSLMRRRDYSASTAFWGNVGNRITCDCPCTEICKSIPLPRCRSSCI